MKKNIIYIHAENNPELKTAEIDESSTVNDIITNYKAVFNVNENDADYEIYLQDEEEKKDKSHPAHDAGIKKHSHVNCHRCHQINISIEYNGKSESSHVSPSTTGAKLLKLAGKKYNITDSDLADLRLKISDDLFIEFDQHIGSFVSYPDCKIVLQLVPKVIIKG